MLNSCSLVAVSAGSNQRSADRKGVKQTATRKVRLCEDVMGCAGEGFLRFFIFSKASVSRLVSMFQT